MCTTIQCVFSSSVATAVLQYFDPMAGFSSAFLRITLPNGEIYHGSVQTYEYEETRRPGDFTAGYYRLCVTHLNTWFEYDPINDWYDARDVSIDIDPVWSDWYYLAANVYYSGGQRQEYEH